MNKKQGFTLIELLAVIVVLAIIALIATPIVMNTIKRSKKGATERSADSYVKQVEVVVATERLNGNILEGEYQITSDGNLCRDRSVNCSDDKKIKIEMNGTKPSSGKIKITNGTVDQASSSMTIGNYDVTYNSTKKTYEAREKGSSTTPDSPQVEVLCTAKVAATTGNVPSGNYAYGDEYTCELGDNEEKTFFILETNGDKVSLIMDRNIDSNGKGTTSDNTVEWVSKEDYLAAGGTESNYGSYGNNNLGPITAQNYLKSSTKGWTKLTESQISLPTGEQIATAGGDDEWSDDRDTDTTLSTWLYGNLNEDSVPYSYWTSTPHASTIWSELAWSIDFGGILYAGNVSSGSAAGIRPVIILSKSQLG